MATAAQSSNSQAAASQQNLRRRAPNPYAANFNAVPLSTKYAPALEASAAIDLAHAFSRLEVPILEIDLDLQDAIQKRTGGPVLITDELEIIRMRTATALADIKDVHAGKFQFSTQYLRDTQLLPHWINMGVELRGQHGKAILAMDWARNLERLAAFLPDTLRFAARHDLDVQSRIAIGEKYMEIERVFNQFDDRKLITWHDLSRELRELAAVKPVPITNLTPSSRYLSLILWITFISSVGCSIPNLINAGRYTTNEPGTQEEDDYFFLLQSSIMGVFGLIVTCISVRRTTSTPWIVWLLPSVIAIVAMILAPILYPLKPKWWSSALALFATSTQSFLVLQLALYGA